MKEKSINNFLKQKKILLLLKTFSDERLDKITEDEFNLKKLTKKELYLFLECVWIDIGKEQATNKEMSSGIKHIYALFVLEDLRRHGLLKLNKRGFFDRTKLGNSVKKYLETKCRKK